jgi:DNA-directed RNA polymerase beta subunit
MSRYPIQGDKFASRNAQKGTIGKIVYEWDMPCDRFGRVLNFIVSCPSVIKRETYGQLAEPALNNYLIQNGIYSCNFGIDEPNSQFI